MIAHTQGGIVVAVVKSLEDKEGLGRIQVTYPHLNDQVSDWARLVSPMAGGRRGLFLRPEVGDEVLIGWEQGDPRRPYVLGSLWSKTDQPPPDDGDAARNNWRFLVSRSGHVLRFDDTEGAEAIELVDKDGSRRVRIDSANQVVRVEADAGDVSIKASGKVTVEAAEVEVKASTVSIKSDGAMSLEAGGTLTLKGATVNIN